MRETRVKNSGLLKECRRLGHPYTAGFSTKHYLTDKLRWSVFSFSITMLVFEKQLFQFTIGSFTWSPSLNKGSYKKSVSTPCRFKFWITRRLFTPQPPNLGRAISDSYATDEHLLIFYSCLCLVMVIMWKIRWWTRRAVSWKLTSLSKN